jgi:ubiquinone biosynthesis protein
MVFWLSSAESARVGHIAHALFKHNLGFVLARLGLRKALPFGLRIKTEHFKEKEMSPQIVLKIFEDLDGTFIKLGQLLSLRPDLLPAQYCEELSKLQDNVKPFPGHQAKEIIEKELKKPISSLFSHFEEDPVAAASLGQVHLATLKDGTKVAVKVQRPGIQTTVKLDIRLLYRVADLARKRYGTAIINPVEIVREFERYTDNELNYIREAHNIDLFYKNFDKSKTILIPKVFWNYTTSKVLTMEYVPGKRLSSVEEFKPASRKKLLDRIINSEFEQMFIHGLFHADPHPGNFIIKKNGAVALLDFGIVGRLDYVMKEHITDMFVNMMNGNVDGMVDAAVKLGMADENADTGKLRRDIYDGLAMYHNTPLDKVKMSNMLSNIITIMRNNSIKISPNFVLLAKAVVTLESVASNLDPKFNLAQSAQPFIKRLARDRLSPRKIAERTRKKVQTMIDFVSAVPQTTNKFIAELHDTDRDLRRIDKDISSLTVEIDRSSNRLTLGFLAGTLLISSTILLPFLKTGIFGMPVLSLAGYIIGLAIMISIFISILREKKI